LLRHSILVYRRLQRMEPNLFSLQKTLQNYGILISFSGRFSQEIIEELGDAVKKYLESESISQHDTYNVFSIFIEQTQNIKNYSASKENSSGADKIANSGIVTIGKSDVGHFVSSGNLIDSEDAQVLMSKLTSICSLDKVGLKKMYKEELKKDIPEDSIGAGLGLIDMARKASRPLEFSLIQLDHEYYFFTLNVYV